MIKILKRLLLRLVTDVDPKPFIKSKIQTIIILRYDRIGDMIVSLPLCKALKKSIPSANITVIASSANADISSGCNYIDQTLIKPRQLIEWLSMLILLRRKKYSLAIDLNHAVTPHTIFAIRLLKPDHVASPFKDGRWGVEGSELKLFNLMPPQHEEKYNRPIAETYLDIARLIGCSTEDCIPYPLPHHPKPFDLPDRYVILNPSGSRPTMKLRDIDLIQVVRYILKYDNKIKILIPCLSDDFDRVNLLFLKSLNTNVLRPLDSPKELLPLVQHSSLVVTPDTALVHLACAYDIPLVAIYTNDEALFAQWQPYGCENSAIIRSKEPQSLVGYDPDEILASITQVLDYNKNIN